MYIYLSTGQLRRMGFSKTDIRKAVTCCLTRLARGRYVVKQVCADPRHRVLWAPIEVGSGEEFADTGDMRDKVERLRVLIRARGEHLAVREVAVKSRRRPEVLSHITAALIHGLPLSRMVESRVEVSRAAVCRTYSHLRVRRREIPAAQITRVGIYRVTTLERTLIDVARDHPLDVSVPMIDHALRKGATTTARIAEELEACAEVVGTKQVKIALDLADGRRESVAESVCAVRFFEHRIGGFEAQCPLFDEAGRFLGRVDFCHRASRTVVEVDGLGKYYLGSGTPRVELEKERQREAAIRAAGYQVVRLSWKQLFESEPFFQFLELTAARVGRI